MHGVRHLSAGGAAIGGRYARHLFSDAARPVARQDAARQDAARAARQRDSCAAASPQLLPTSCARPHAPLRAPPPLSGAPRLPQALAPVACAGSGACSARQRTGRARHRRMPHGMAGGVCSTRQCDRGGARGRRACAPASPVRPSQEGAVLLTKKEGGSNGGEFFPLANILSGSSHEQLKARTNTHGFSI